MRAGDEIVWAEPARVVFVVANAFITDVRDTRGPTSQWPETLIFDVLTLWPKIERRTFARPFLMEPIRKTG
jgi:hypothetical protein